MVSQTEILDRIQQAFADAFLPVEGELNADTGFDTIVLQNVVEHVQEDTELLQRVAEALAPGGRAIILAPQGPGLFGSLDRLLGHARRYAQPELAALGEAAGLTPQRIVGVNRVGSVAWWINSRLLRRRRFSLLQIKLLNVLVPLLRKLEWLPLPPLTLVGVFEKPVASAESTEKLQPATTGLLFE